ncbi:response regulator [Pseudoduganella violacea]|uniref:CheY-like chemotaxis protein n=1 Tax=Pseudoduganella violacea TaxID=1715466 RepID=A0A7W5FW83_9BURK|nr:response regulator [Pseudoduganella violacea]MBB3121760.1 CheY-like chemotaxis protein [Pseudoduganella violacea]
MARILIVEDTPGNMVLTSMLLESKGHTLFCAERALPGIAIAQQEALDLILMDVQLPEVDGLTAMGLLKGDARTRVIPVVALTAYAMKGDRERLLASGFDGYIEKPIEPMVFLDEVERLLSKGGT